MTSGERPQRIHRYLTAVADSERWDQFTPRAGDIIVATAPKWGTTWTQMICALIVHQSPSLPQPLTRLSRWLDRLSQPIDEVIADLDAQPFRRIIKTHTPLDGLPWFAEASYVICGRDPRDAFLSMQDHLANTSAQTMAEALERAGLPADFRFPDDPDVRFEQWMTVPANPWEEDGFPSGSATHFANTYWAFRRLPNLFFLHYGDLMTDLAGDMRRLSAFLDIPVSERLWPTLVEAAGFNAMKANAAAAAPGAHLGEWRSNADFFRMARMGQWREGLSAQSQALYEHLSAERLAPPLKAWLEGGHAAAGDPKNA